MVGQTPPNKDEPVEALPARGYFTRRIVYPRELPSIMRKHIYTGAMGAVYFTLISGIFFVYYGTAIGLTRLQWGVMGGVSSFLLSAQLASAIFTQRLGRRKMLWFWFAIADRGLRFLGILTSLLLWHAGFQTASLVLIAGIAVSNLFGAMAAPPWMSWLADIIPEQEQGRFWGRREAWIAVAVVAAVIPAAVLMDRTPPERKVSTAMIVFTAAAIVGLLDLIIHGTIPEPPASSTDEPLMRQIGRPFQDRAFRPWLLFNACWTFAMTLGGALSILYFVDELGLKKNFVGGTIVLAVLPLIGSMTTARWSGRLVDRAGPKRVLFWSHLFWATLPLFWLIASPRTALIWLGLSSVIGGVSSTAGTSAATKLITRLPPAPDRAMYVAVSSCVGSIAGGLGVLTAGAVLQAFSGWEWRFLGLTVVGFHGLFLASLALRVASTLGLVHRLRDPRAPRAANADPSRRDA